MNTRYLYNKAIKLQEPEQQEDAQNNGIKDEEVDDSPNQELKDKTNNHNSSPLDLNKNADDTGSNSQVPSELQNWPEDSLDKDKFREPIKQGSSRVNLYIRGKPVVLR